MKNQKSLPSLSAAQTGGAVYSAGTLAILAVSFLLGILIAVLRQNGWLDEGYAATDGWIYLSFLLGPFSYATVLAVLFFKTKTKLKTVYRGTKGRYFFYAVLLQFGLFSLSRLNEFFLTFLQNIGFTQVNTQVSVPSLEGWRILPALLVIAVLPAILEETVFRGVLLGSLKQFGGAFSVLACGALFALFHQNPAQTIYQFACGCAFALVAYKSGSILPTVLSHFLNNALVLLLEKFSLSLSSAFFVCSAVALVLSLALLLFDKGQERPSSEKEGTKKDFFLYALPGIAVCALIWIAGLFGI